MKTYEELRNEEIKKLTEDIQEATEKSSLLYTRPFLVAAAELVSSPANVINLAEVIRTASALYENEKKRLAYETCMRKD